MKISRLTYGIILLLACALGVEARESLHTSRGRAPMYWMAYEQCFVDNNALDETRWRKNIDWVAENLLPLGYDMVCTDGWIEGAQTVNEYGYITKYNSGWGQDFSFYKKLAERKGLDCGIYYNPLWMSRAAHDRNAKVKGSTVGASDICGAEKFNDFIYWVDTDRPGSEQWIKGYVRHFIDLGFKFLRVDFLNMYENAYGTVRYRRALKWIMEEAGDELFVSLVMPNSWNHAKSEREFGDLFRISEDVFGGGFDFVSQRRRGVRYDGWANWGNLYDGFLDFSDIDRSEIMMDGDFVRLNTCARDCEKEFWISLLVMAGSPVAVADQYDTVGDNLRFYSNRSLLSLVKEGFYGKPLSRDASDDKSNIWVGTCENGDRVLAFFNREENARVIDYNPADAGVPVSLSYVTELWSGEQSRISPASPQMKVRLAAHSCKVYRFSANPGAGVEALHVDETSGQTGIYNLCGVKVADDRASLTEPGIYVLKTNSESRKIVVR